MDIPPELEIRASIKPGSVYYFRHDEISRSHYFTVINKNPSSDAIILLLCGSSQIEKKRLWYSACPPETLVIVKPSQYRDFSLPTVINCNNVFEVTIQHLIKKHADGLLELKADMSMAIVEALRRGVLASPLVELRIKAMLE